jgi:DNA-binding NarL/FixJ family response regulator
MGIPALADRSVRALVIDGHEATGLGVGLLLERQPWVARCRLTRDRAGAVALLARERADVAVLDISDLGVFTAMTVTALRAAHPGLRIVLSSRCAKQPPSPPHAFGASGFLPAGSTAAETLAAIRSALLDEPPKRTPAPRGTGEPRLSPRERDILSLLATGATNLEIATDLRLGPETVKKQVSALYRKLGVRNRTEAVAQAGSSGSTGRSDIGP